MQARKQNLRTPFRVTGTVRTAENEPAASVAVNALHRRLREEHLLGETKTDKAGHYEISYDPKRLLGREDADLIVRVFDRGTFGVSDVLFHAPPDAKIDVTLPSTAPPPAEHDKLVQQIAPGLEDVALDSLTADEISLLARKTGTDERTLARLSGSAKLETSTKLPASLFYALASQGLPTDLPALLVVPSARHSQALQAAIEANIVTAAAIGSVDTAVAELRQLLVRQTLDAPRASGDSLGKLLGTILKADAQQQEFVQRYLQREGTTEQFWAALREDKKLGKQVDDLQFALQLGTLTQNHVALVQVVQAMKKAGTVATMRDLARLDAADWQDVLQKGRIQAPPNTPGATDAERNVTYAAGLARVLELAHPTAAVAGRLKKEQFSGAAELADFLDQNPDFNLAATPVRQYLQTAQPTSNGKPQRAGKAVAAAAVAAPGQVAQLQQAQRMAKISTGASETVALIKSGLSSAAAIAGMGQNNFVKKYGTVLGDSAPAIYQKAGHVSAAALNLWANVNPGFNLQPGGVLPAPMTSSEIPDLETLFGSNQLCECQECRSMLSPAAYLTDILHFLSKRILANGDSAKDVLFARRPDIGNIVLNCANTNTPLPYVDLVNELLEDAVAKKVNNDFVAPARQTTKSAAELAAEPEHENDLAYQTLAAAVYPWTLPFDLPLEEVRSYLNHIGVPRHEIMRTFQAAGSPLDLDIALEYLGLNRTEAEIIIGSFTGASDTDFWGGAASGTNPSVRDFLDRSGLTFVELTELLGMKYVNPYLPASVAIVADVDNGADVATCDPAQMKFDPFDADTANRMRRFVKLWRKLRWAMRDLDRAITALIPPAATRAKLREFTPDFFECLAGVHRIRTANPS